MEHVELLRGVAEHDGPDPAGVVIDALHHIIDVVADDSPTTLVGAVLGDLVRPHPRNERAHRPPVSESLSQNRCGRDEAEFALLLLGLLGPEVSSFGHLWVNSNLRVGAHDNSPLPCSMQEPILAKMTNKGLHDFPPELPL